MKEICINKVCKHPKSEHNKSFDSETLICMVGVFWGDRRKLCECWDGQFDEFGDLVRDLRGEE